MSSLSLKVATLAVELLKCQTLLSGVTIGVAESDAAANKNRITVTANTKDESIEGTGIYWVDCVVDLSNVTGAATQIDSWLAEVDAAFSSTTGPATPSAGYLAAKAAFGSPAQFTITNEGTDTARETTEKTRKLHREYKILAQQGT